MAETIIDEIHEIRTAISEKFHGDIAAIAADAAARQLAAGRPVWHANASNKRATSNRGLAGRRSRSAQPSAGGVR